MQIKIEEVCYSSKDDYENKNPEEYLLYEIVNEREYKRVRYHE